VDKEGHPISRKIAFKRYVASWLWFIPPFAASAALHLSAIEVTTLTLGWVAAWALLSRLHPQRQFLHDALAGTRLISVR
jgi:hypothetical protein